MCARNCDCQGEISLSEEVFKVLSIGLPVEFDKISQYMSSKIKEEEESDDSTSSDNSEDSTAESENSTDIEEINLLSLN